MRHRHLFLSISFDTCILKIIQGTSTPNDAGFYHPQNFSLLRALGIHYGNVLTTVAMPKIIL
jgi:hypothetical protein